MEESRRGVRASAQVARCSRRSSPSDHVRTADHADYDGPRLDTLDTPAAPQRVNSYNHTAMASLALSPIHLPLAGYFALIGALLWLLSPGLLRKPNAVSLLYCALALAALGVTWTHMFLYFERSVSMSLLYRVKPAADTFRIVPRSITPGQRETGQLLDEAVAREHFPVQRGMDVRLRDDAPVVVERAAVCMDSGSVHCLPPGRM